MNWPGLNSKLNYVESKINSDRFLVRTINKGIDYDYNKQTNKLVIRVHFSQLIIPPTGIKDEMHCPCASFK